MGLKPKSIFLNDINQQIFKMIKAVIFEPDGNTCTDRNIKGRNLMPQAIQVLTMVPYHGNGADVSGSSWTYQGRKS